MLKYSPGIKRFSAVLSVNLCCDCIITTDSTDDYIESVEVAPANVSKVSYAKSAGTDYAKSD